MIFTCLLLLVCANMSVHAQSPAPKDTVPAFPPDPGEVYVPSVVTILGQEIGGDTTATEEVDVFGDQTVTYDPVDKVLTLTGATLTSEDSLISAINYVGTDPLVIVLCDTSSIVADTVIQSSSDIYITGEGWLELEGTVPIIGKPEAIITFDSVSMHVKSLPSQASVRRRIRNGKLVDETGGPALSGFGGADFNKVNVSPSDAEYTEVPLGGSGDDEEDEVINALAVQNEDGSYEILDEFTLTAMADDDDAVEDIRVPRTFNPALPTYNILGLPVDATYKGIVVQQGQTYLLQ